MSSVTSTKSEQPTLTSILQQLYEIEEIMDTTRSKLEFVCDESEPKDEDKSDGQPTVSLAILQRRVNNIRRVANGTATLTTKLLGH